MWNTYLSNAYCVLGAARHWAGNSKADKKIPDLTQGRFEQRNELLKYNLHRLHLGKAKNRGERLTPTGGEEAVQRSYFGELKAKLQCDGS